MRELRHFPIERFIELDVPRGAWEPLFRTDDVGDLHKMVVYHACEVIGWKSIRLQDHEVVDERVVEFNAMPHRIGHYGRAVFGHGEFHRRTALVLESVRSSRRQQLLRGGVILVEAFGLAVGPVLASDVWTLVPVEPEPFQCFQDRFDRSCYFSGLVGVLDAKDELSSMPPGEQPGKEGSADVADVRFARWAWRVSDSNVAHASLSLKEDSTVTRSGRSHSIGSADSPPRVLPPRPLYERMGDGLGCD